MTVLHVTTATLNSSAATFSNPLLSDRAVINLGFPYAVLYAFINHYLIGDASTSPVGTSFTATTKTWNQVIDANGWPNDPSVSGTLFGGSIRIPASADYTGKYVITWAGDGRVNFGGGTWTVDTGLSSNYTQHSNGSYSNTAGLVPRIVVTVTGYSITALIGVQFSATAPLGNGAYLKNFKFYRLGDEADLLAGKVFRQGFKQSLVNLNPGAIRFMDWAGGNGDMNCRFEDRTLPTNAGYGMASTWAVSPAYGNMTFTNANQYTCAAVTTGLRQTPVSMTHGEMVIARIPVGSGTVRIQPYGIPEPVITAVSIGANGRVTTSLAHGFATGDTIICHMNGGMTQLHKRPCVITVVNTTQFDLNIATTGFSAFTSGTCNQFVTLNVGSRGAYPIIFKDGGTLASTYGQGYMDERFTLTYVFDKTLSAHNDSSGNPVYGVWIFNSMGAFSYNSGHWGGVPLEICVALVNEVNDMSLMQGKNNPVHMWLNVPHVGLSSMDPDYTAASNWAVNAVDVVINPSSSVRTAGYAALGYTVGGVPANQASLIVEYSNETWNAAAAFPQTFYLATRGSLRWPASGVSDYISMTSLRSTVMARDVRAAFPGNERVKFTLAGQGSEGYDSNINKLRVIGSSYYLADTLVTAGSFGTPISNHDAFAIASYFDAGHDTVYYGPGKGVGTFTDDSAMYNGTNNTGNPGGVNYSGAANPTQAITNFVNAVKVSGYARGMNLFCDPANPTAGLDYTFSNAMAGFGKVAIQYEGGPDWKTSTGDASWGGYTLTAGMSLFTTAVLNSSQWGAAHVAYLNAKSALAASALPALYIIQNSNGSGGVAQRWAYCSPDTYAGGVEGQALVNNPAWTAIGTRNQALVV